MRMAMDEFPALDDGEAHAEALQLLDACAAGSLEPWTAVLSLLLGESATLAGVCLQQSTVRCFNKGCFELIADKSSSSVQLSYM
jgi:hypothetical protein